MEFNLMALEDKRDFREETLLNAAEWQQLKAICGKYGVSKAAGIRLCIHIVGDKLTRDERLRDTDGFPEL
jgi:hypothetical protein